MNNPLSEEELTQLEWMQSASEREGNWILRLITEVRDSRLQTEVSTLKAAALGSWAWALEQMKAGKSVKRLRWAAPDPRISPKHPRTLSLSVDDVTSTDWQLAPEGEGGGE